MNAWNTKHLCVKWALALGSLGVAVAAYGQDVGPPALAPTGDPMTDIMMVIVEKYGAPGLLMGLLGWQGARKLSGGIPVVHRIHEEDRSMIREIIKEMKDDGKDQGEPRDP